MRGNTLVGLLAGLAIMEVTGTALVSVFSQYATQQAHLDLKTSGQALKSEMADEFSKMATCIAAIDASSTLTQEGDGSWPISMKVPDLPDTLLTSHSDRVLGSYGLKVRRLYMDRLADTGIKGPKKQPLYTGNVIVQFDAVADGMISIREQTISQLFVEVQNGRIISCANNNDPTMALSSACNRVGGEFSEDTMKCSMDALSESIATNSYLKVKDYLDTDYRKFLNEEAQKRIDDQSRITYERSVRDSNSVTDQSEGALNQTIVANTATANTAILQVNNTLNNDVRDLGFAIDGANSLTGQAQNVAGAANATSAAANAQTNAANGHSASAQDYVNQANWMSDQANATSNAARNTAAQANATTDSANGTTNYANATAATANQYSGAANGTSNAANATTGSADATASSANNYATSAFNAASSANTYATAAANTSNAANSTSSNAVNVSGQSENTTSGANWWVQQWAGRQSYATYANEYQTRSCVVGGAACALQ